MQKFSNCLRSNTPREHPIFYHSLKLYEGLPRELNYNPIVRIIAMFIKKIATKIYRECHLRSLSYCRPRSRNLKKCIRFSIAAFTILLVSSNSVSENSSVQRETLSVEIESFDRERNILVPMRDGISLSSSIIFPKGKRKNLPAILIRTPYDFDEISIPSFLPLYAHWLHNGYALVFQNERGTHWSGGRYDEFLPGAKKDGYDSVDWISKQSWSNGAIGTFGCSSPGENQLGLATQGHPAHKAMIPMAPGAGIGKVGRFQEQGNFYRGGVWQSFWLYWYSLFGHVNRPAFATGLTAEELESLSNWYDLKPNMTKFLEIDFYNRLRGLPVSSLMRDIGAPKSPLDSYLGLSPADSKWSQLDLVNEGDKIDVPALWVFSWYDVSVAPNIEFYNYIQKEHSKTHTDNSQFMLVSPVAHCAHGSETESTVVGERDLGDARYDYIALFTNWFDYWLKGIKNNVINRPAIELYAMGDNVWRSYSKWPVENTTNTPFYLNHSGAANSRYGTGVLQKVPLRKESVSEFFYDPGQPVPSRRYPKGQFAALGSYDQSEVELRQDVLVYSTPILKEDINVTGSIETVLYVSSDAPDTDFTIKLVDVYPNGKAFDVANSIQRVRYRDGYDNPTFMKKGGIYKVNIGPLATSNIFKKGHRIRVEISSSNFPRYARNLNTGGDNINEIEWKVAHNKIHHSPEYPSRIVLPIVKRR